MGRYDDETSFVGADIHYGDIDKAKQEFKHDSEYSNLVGRKVQHAKAWQNRRPICPYGCGEEGELKEIVMKDGKAIGLYRDSEGLVFTADLQMSPKPTGRKIQIGPDGEPKIVPDN